jgi:negative regulator of sigma E activity
MTGSFTEILLEQETRVSALIDGEGPLPEDGLGVSATEVHQYYQYQLIRQTLRGAIMTSGAHETSHWSQIRLTKLWARIDAQQVDQTD